MIPRVIHYCWFSEDPKPRLVKRCIESWKYYMPDFDIVCWNSKSFDFNSVKYVKEAYEKKQWAFVTDYVRFYAVYKMGGIYLDSDVLVKKNLEPFLANNCFFGTESLADDGIVESMMINPDPAMFGAEANHIVLKKIMEYYENQDFIFRDGTFNKVVCPRVIGTILEKNYSYEHKDKLQNLTSSIRIYPTSFFCNLNQPKNRNVYAIHQFANSWIDNSHRGFFFQFCKKYDQMNLYHRFESIIKKFKL